MKKTGNFWTWAVFGVLAQLSFVFLVSFALVRPLTVDLEQTVNTLVISGLLFGLLGSYVIPNKQLKKLVVSNFWKDKMIFAFLGGYLIGIVNIRMIGFSEISVFWGAVTTYVLKDIYNFLIRYYNIFYNAYLQKNQLKMIDGTEVKK